MVHTLYVHISYLIILDYLFPILLYALITDFVFVHQVLPQYTYLVDMMHHNHRIVIIFYFCNDAQMD